MEDMKDYIRALRHSLFGVGPFRLQIVKELPFHELSPRVKAMMKRNHKSFLTRNSRCPCGSGRRFKRCCQDDR